MSYSVSRQATHLVAAGEAVMMAKQSGVELNAFFDSVRSSAGNSYVFETEVRTAFDQLKCVVWPSSGTSEHFRVMY